jgi:hypothetical protein
VHPRHGSACTALPPLVPPHGDDLPVTSASPPPSPMHSPSPTAPSLQPTSSVRSDAQPSVSWSAYPSIT